MHFPNWLKERIRDWLDIENTSYIAFEDNGSIILCPPRTSLFEPGKLAALAKNPWTISLVSMLFGAIVAKLI